MERVKLSGGWRMRSVGAWMRWSERSEVHRIHPPERSSAMRSDAERTEVLPTEREHQAEGDSPHRTNNSAPWGYLRAVYRLPKVGGEAGVPTFGRR